MKTTNDFIKFRKILVVSLVFITLLSLIAIPAATAGMTTPKETVILQLTQDEAVIVATESIREDHPNSIIVQYDTNRATFILSSPIENLVVVGHGFDEGVKTSNGLLTWKAYSVKLNAIAAQSTILLNCNSNNIEKYQNNPNTISFSDDIDAEIGGWVAGLVISLKTGDGNVLSIADKIHTKFDRVEKGLDDMMTLGLSQNEKAWLITNLIMVIFAMLVNETVLASNVTWSLVSTMIYSYALFSAPVIMASIFYAQGQMTESEFFGALFGFFTTLDDLGFFGDFMDSLWDVSYTTWLLFGAGFLTTVALYVASGSAYFAVRAAIYAVLLLDVAWSTYQDYSDCDDIVGQDPNATCDDGSDGSDGGSGGGGGGGNYYFT